MASAVIPATTALQKIVKRMKSARTMCARVSRLFDQIKSISWSALLKTSVFFQDEESKLLSTRKGQGISPCYQHKETSVAPHSAGPFPGYGHVLPKDIPAVRSTLDHAMKWSRCEPGLTQRCHCFFVSHGHKSRVGRAVLNKDLCHEASSV